MKEIVLNKPKEVILASDVVLADGIIIASSQKENSYYFHPHGIIIKTKEGLFNVITPSGAFQFEDKKSIKELIEYYSSSGWRFYQFKQGNYHF